MQYLYHGSDRKLNVGDNLLCHERYNSATTKYVFGCFATSSLEKAQYFGIINCIRPRTHVSRSRFDNKKIYLEDILTNIKTKFYVYLVDSSDFELDAKNEYICHNEVPILGVKEFDLVDTLNTGGWEVYQIPQINKGVKISETISQIDNFIKSGQAKRVDIAKRIYEQYQM